MIELLQWVLQECLGNFLDELVHIDQLYQLHEGVLFVLDLGRTKLDGPKIADPVNKLDEILDFLAGHECPKILQILEHDFDIETTPAKTLNDKDFIHEIHLVIICLSIPITVHWLQTVFVG